MESLVAVAVRALPMTQLFAAWIHVRLVNGIYGIHGRTVVSLVALESGLRKGKLLFTIL